MGSDTTQLPDLLVEMTSALQGVALLCLTKKKHLSRRCSPKNQIHPTPDMRGFSERLSNIARLRSSCLSHYSNPTSADDLPCHAHKKIFLFWFSFQSHVRKFVPRSIVESAGYRLDSMHEIFLCELNSSDQSKVWASLPDIPIQSTPDPRLVFHTHQAPSTIMTSCSLQPFVCVSANKTLSDRYIAVPGRTTKIGPRPKSVHDQKQHMRIPRLGNSTDSSSHFTKRSSTCLLHPAPKSIVKKNRIP